MMEAGRGDSLVGRRVRQFESKSASPGVQRRILWRQMRLEVLPHKLNVFLRIHLLEVNKIWLGVWHLLKPVFYGWLGFTL